MRSVERRIKVLETKCDEEGREIEVIFIGWVGADFKAPLTGEEKEHIEEIRRKGQKRKVLLFRI